MSAECKKCGADLTYPPGSWPVGSCEPCDLRAELKAVRSSAVRLADAAYDAEDFINRVEKWTGSVPDERNEILSALRVALSQLRAVSEGTDGRAQAEREFLDASIAVWEQLDRFGQLPAPKEQVGEDEWRRGQELREREKAAWERLRRVSEGTDWHHREDAPVLPDNWRDADH